MDGPGSSPLCEHTRGGIRRARPLWRTRGGALHPRCTVPAPSPLPVAGSPLGIIHLQESHVADSLDSSVSIR